MTAAPAQTETPANLALHEHGLNWRRIAGREVANLDRLALVVSAPHPDGGYSFGVVEQGGDGAVVVHREGRAETRANARRDAVLAAGDVLGVVDHATAQAMATTAIAPGVTGWVRTCTYLLLGGIFVGSAALVAGLIVTGLRAAGVLP